MFRGTPRLLFEKVKSGSLLSSFRCSNVRVPSAVMSTVCLAGSSTIPESVRFAASIRPDSEVHVHLLFSERARSLGLTVISTQRLQKIHKGPQRKNNQTCDFLCKACVWRSRNNLSANVFHGKHNRH